MHTGSFDSEPATVQLMEQYIAKNAYENDFSSERMHREIYLSDPRQTPLERLKYTCKHMQ